MPARSFFRRLSFASLVLVLGAMAPSCKQVDISISIEDDPDFLLRERASWVEFNIFENQCPDEETLATGNYPIPLRSEVVAATDPLPALGKLATGTYGFGVLLRGEKCEILGYGCKKANVETATSVAIKLFPTYTDENGELLPEGACEAPKTCQVGRCSDEGGGEGGAGGQSGAGGAGGGKAGNGGAGGAVVVPKNTCSIQSPAGGCKMQLVGWGEIPAPAKGASLGGPGVVATGKGFVVAYHEMAPDGATRQVKLLPLNTDGCYGTPASKSFDKECPGSPFDPGLGASWNEIVSGGAGLLVFSRQPCTAQQRGAGVGLVRFGEGGTILDGASLDNPDTTFPAITISSQHAVARGLGAEEFRLSYAQRDKGTGKDSAFTFPVSGVSAAGDFLPILTENNGGTTYAVSSRSSGLLVQAVNGNDMGGAKQTILKISKDAGTPVLVPRPATDGLALRAFSGGSGNRIVTLGQSAGGHQLDWTLLKDDGTELAPPSKLLDKHDLGFDAAVASDRLVFVMGQANSFLLQWLGGASANPAVEGSQTINATNIPPLGNFDGKQIAVAGGNGRVVVAWVVQKPAGDAPGGGVAVFRCEP